MSLVKTAICLEETLFRRIDALARAMRLPRSRVFALAAEEYVRKYDNRQLLERLNRAYADGLDPAEQAELAAMKSLQRQLLAEDEW